MYEILFYWHPMPRKAWLNFCALFPFEAMDCEYCVHWYMYEVCLVCTKYFMLFCYVKLGAMVVNGHYYESCSHFWWWLVDMLVMSIEFKYAGDVVHAIW